jgi:PhoPQ-activated pathogenicity-related protein
MHSTATLQASMKAAEEYMTQQKWGDISAGGWVVAGASKRGWTTWMVGAVTCDTCVTIKGIIPMVPIVPSLKEEVRRQYQSYNGFTFAFADYMEAGILTRFDEPAVTTMLSIVQPDEYAGRLARLPKLAVLSSDDEFMQMDWTELWYGAPVVVWQIAMLEEGSIAAHVGCWGG